MQTKRRLVHIPPTVTCPICGKNSHCIHKSPSYVASTPSVNALRSSNGSSVWIDPTVVGTQIMAPPEQRQVKVSPKYTRPLSKPHSDITRIPTVPQVQKPPMWQYDSPKFEVESSLPSLSLVVAELPTHPRPFLPVSAALPAPHIDEIDTTPPANRLAALVQVPAESVVVPETNDAQLSSWTAGGSATSAYARRIAERNKRKEKSRPRLSQNVALNPLDRLRWWLLRPGRLEFLLWLGGTILLMTVTCILLLVTALSFAWITPGQGNISSALNNDSNAATRGAVTVVTTPGLKLTLLTQGPLLPGQTIHVRGDGFTANGNVTFTHDTMLPVFDQDAQPAAVKADGHGSFIATLLLRYPTWGPGQHQIVARDQATSHLAELTLTLASVPFGQKATATPGPGTATPASGSPGGNPTPGPVNQTPVPVTPSPSLSPTAGTTPSPTATQGTTPTPTPGTTPTVNTTPTAAATHITNASGAGLGNALNNSTYVGGQEALLIPAFITLGLGLALLLLALFMLGMAGILQKRRS